MRIAPTYRLDLSDVDINGAVVATAALVEVVTGRGIYTAPVTLDNEGERRQYAQDAGNRLPSNPSAARQINTLLCEALATLRQGLSGPKLVRLSDVQSKMVEWLWPNRIALGKITLIIGDPGLGKSFLTIYLAGVVSTGSPWPDDPFDQQQVPADVILMNAEDALDDTIGPRLDDAGADKSRVIALEGVKSTDPETGQERVLPFTLSHDLPKLQIALEQNPNVRLVVIDPVSAYLGKTDSHNNSEVRGLLAPLAALASKFNVAMVLISHMNKGGGSKSVYRVNGSLAFPAAARAAWLVAKDDQDEGRRLFLSVKNNLAQDVGGLAFRIVDGRLAWEEHAVTLGADDVLGESEKPTKCDEAEGWLRDLLRHGPKAFKEIESEAKAAGLAITTIRRAQKALHIKPTKEGFGAGWTWQLPTSSPKVFKDDHLRPALESWSSSGGVGHLRDIDTKNPHFKHTFPPREAHSHEDAQRGGGRDDPPEFDLEHLP